MKNTEQYKVDDAVVYKQYFGLTLMMTEGVIIEVDGDGLYLAIRNKSGAIHYTGRSKIVNRLEFTTW